MALALIDFVSFEKGSALFRIDTGTNTFYKLKVGRSRAENSGIKWVDEIIHSTALKQAASRSNLLNTQREIALPSEYFYVNGLYVQLSSFKNEQGKSPTFSRVLTMPAQRATGNSRRGPLVLSTSLNTECMSHEPLNDCRYVPGVNPGYAYQTGLEDILSSIAKAAMPLIGGLLSGNTNGGGQNGTAAAGTPGAQAGIGLLNTLLNSLLNGFGTAAKPSVQQSLMDNDNPDNRFMSFGQEHYSQPFFLAALLPMLGPVLQALPQLMNAKSDADLKKKQEANKLVKDLVSDTNKRLTLLQFLQNMPQQGNAGNIDPTQLLQLLQQLPEAKTATAASIAMSYEPATFAASLSASTVLTFETSKKVMWNGSEKAVYAQKANITFRVKLNVTGAAPKSPLPKAIVKLCFRDPKTSKNYFEKTFKLKDVMPEAVLPFAFTREELAIVPPGQVIMVYAELRWKTKSGKEIKALGTTDIVVSGSYFLKEQGKAIDDTRELKDMKVYKAFWNKVWEAPLLDTVKQKNSDTKKYRWALKVNGKYFFSLTGKHDSNGLLETRVLKGKDDPESLIAKTEGRLKGGMELSLSELNKLCSLWDKQQPLAPEKLDAFKTDSFADHNACEMAFNIKLEGRAEERGLVWVVPVFKRVDFTLCKIKTSDDSGLVTETEEEKVQLPLPVSARILGLKST